MCPLFRGSTVHKEEDNFSTVDKMAGPKCPLFGDSTVHKEEDNLSIVDKMAGPKCPLFGDSTVHREEDNLSIMDNLFGYSEVPQYSYSCTIIARCMDVSQSYMQCYYINVLGRK